jgi:hypothetical protein
LRAPDQPWISIGRRWLDFAWDQTRRGELIEKLVAKDPRLFPIAATYLPFHLAGLRDEELRATIARMLEQAVMEDAAWTLMVPAISSMEIALEPALIEKARPRSVLANRTEVALLSDDDIYLLTHECLYATGWGRRAASVDRATHDYLLRTLPLLVVRTRDNADLLAESILVSHLVALTCVDQTAWDALEEAQLEAGNVVSPEAINTAFPRAKHPALGRTYHTTIASILAWMSCHARCRT